MKQRFDAISQEYGAFVREMLRKGQLPMRSTEKGFWNPAIDAEVFEAFSKLGLNRYKSFLDLGSGDGRVSLIASLFVPRAEGVESDAELHRVAEGMKQKLNVPNAKFHHNDFFMHDISSYDALFINPDTHFSRGLEQKLLMEMRGDLIVLGHHFHPQPLPKKSQIEINGSLFSVYGKS